MKKSMNLRKNAFKTFIVSILQLFLLIDRQNSIRITIFFGNRNNDFLK